MSRIAIRVAAYTSLTKPRIIELLLVTTVPTMFVAAKGVPSIWLIVATLIGGTLAAGGANALNMVIDRDIDALMDRTKNRPIPSGVISPRNALIFACVLEAIAFLWLWGFTNLLSACLAISATAFYIFIYSLWLKRTSEQNIVIGGAAGAVPVLVGWAAVQNSLAWTPIILFGIIFVWTPPHFWALAIYYKNDYANAKIPMMPVVRTIRRVSFQIFAYTLLLVGLSFLFGQVAGLGAIYLGSAFVLGLGFIWMSISLMTKSTTAKAMKLFHFSIAYMTLLFSAIAVDQLVLGS